MLLTILLILCLIAALFCFIQAYRFYSTARVNLIALGLFFIALYFLLPLLVSLTAGSHHYNLHF